MSRIDRIQRAVSASRTSKSEARRAETSDAAGSTNLPVPVGPVIAPRSFREERRRAGAELAAQLIGQDGQRRGLRAGPSIHDTARSAYNSVEWSGSFDRRARKGRAARTDI